MDLEVDRVEPNVSTLCATMYTDAERDGFPPELVKSSCKGRCRGEDRQRWLFAARGGFQDDGEVEGKAACKGNFANLTKTKRGSPGDRIPVAVLKWRPQQPGPAASLQRAWCALTTPLRHAELPRAPAVDITSRQPGKLSSHLQLTPF